MTIAPVSAVPTEMPRLVIVFCRPSDLAALLVGDRGDGDAAELRGEGTRSRGRRGAAAQVTTSAPAPASRAADQHHQGQRKSPRKPSRTTRRGDTSGKAFGIPAAARIRVKESGSRRTPVSIAERPSATERKSGTAKKSPPWRKYWKKNEVRPPRRTEVAQDRRVDAAAHAPRVQEAVLPGEEERQHRGAAEHHPDHWREAEPFGASGLALTSPQVPERRTPSTISPRPAPRARCRPGRAAPSSSGSPRDAAGEDEDREHDGPRRRRRSARRGRW